jgi:DNA/RNA endonuclease G (NUC1)
MIPAADFTMNQDLMNSTFTMANISPQVSLSLHATLKCVTKNNLQL